MVGHEIAMIYQDALSSLNQHPYLFKEIQMAQLTKRGGNVRQKSYLSLLD